MNGSDTVAPLCAAFRSRDREWGPVDPRAGRQAQRVKEKGMDLSVVVCYSSAEGEQL